MKSKERIQFSKNLVVTPSPRGYVTAHVRGTYIYVEKSLDQEFKQKIEKMSYQEHLKPWKEAMETLEKETIDEAKKIFKKKYGHG